MKTMQLTDTEGKASGWVITCPACGNWHLFDSRWTFNGDTERPTFRASMLVHESRWPDGTIAHHRCHSFVTNGKIQFLGDCTHNMAGQTVDLPDVDD